MINVPNTFLGDLQYEPMPEKDKHNPNGIVRKFFSFNRKQLKEFNERHNLNVEDRLIYHYNSFRG